MPYAEDRWRNGTAAARRGVHVHTKQHLTSVRGMRPFWFLSTRTKIDMRLCSLRLKCDLARATCTRASYSGVEKGVIWER